MQQQVGLIRRNNRCQITKQQDTISTEQTLQVSKEFLQATIVPWSSSSVPTGFLECNGANVSRSTYSALFAIIGTTYGAGDGASTFGLPDLQDNVAIGKSGTKALASTGGANTVAA